MATKVIKYPLDKTGTSPDNLVLAEPHTVPRTNSRTFATLYGPYYTDSLVVREMVTTTELVRGTQYRCIGLYQDATVALGKSVSAAIIILDENIGSELVIDYQVVGGPYSLSSDAINDLFGAMELDNRKVNYSDIIGLPVTFPPSPHLHDAGDLYGFEDIVAAIETLRTAILTGDVASHEQIYDYIDRIKNLIYTDIDKLNTRTDNLEEAVNELQSRMSSRSTITAEDVMEGLRTHVHDDNNPHGVTADQIGLGSVANYPPATNNDAVDQTNDYTYLTPANLWAVLTNKVLSIFNKHVDDITNPHNVTADQIGLGDVANYPVATEGEATEATRNDRLMTPLRVMQLINDRVLPSINNHITNKNNPHAVTLEELGGVPVTRTVFGATLDADITVDSVDLPWYTRDESDTQFEQIKNWVTESTVSQLRYGETFSFKPSEQEEPQALANAVVVGYKTYSGEEEPTVSYRQLYANINGEWVLVETGGGLI